jgi:hypothetical protein
VHDCGKHSATPCPMSLWRSAGQATEALRPSPFDKQEPTLNAALALIISIHPRSEMEALIAALREVRALTLRELAALNMQPYSRRALELRH